VWTAVVLVGFAAADELATSQAVSQAHEEYVAAIAAAKEDFQQAIEKAHQRYLRQIKAAADRGGIAGGGISEPLHNLPKKEPPGVDWVNSPFAKDKPTLPILERKPKRAPIDWSEVYRRSARVRVMGAEPVLLTASEESGWERVPPALEKRPAYIHSDREDTYNGVADIDVTRDGILLVACNYGDQGNGGGDWDEKRWTKEQFIENGWTLVPDEDLGGVLVKKGGREQVVFLKHVKNGENYRLRCNKYDPPFAIVFP
jgi:hypothetical protein